MKMRILGMMISSLLVSFKVLANPNVTEYVERVACRMNQACTGIFSVDPSLQKGLIQGSDETRARYNAIKAQVDQEVQTLRGKITERQALIKSATAEFATENGQSPKSGPELANYQKQLVSFVESKLTPRGLSASTIGRELNLAYGESSLGAANNPIERLATAYRHSQVIGLTSDFSQKTKIGNEKPEFAARRFVGVDTRLGTDMQSVVQPRTGYQLREYSPEISDRYRPIDEDLKYQRRILNELARTRDNSYSTRLDIDSTSPKEVAEVREKVRNYIKDNKVYQKLNGKGVTGAIFGLAVTGVEAASLSKDIKDCQKKYNLTEDEVKWLNQVSRTMGGAYDQADCSKVLIDPSSIKALYELGGMSEGMNKLVAGLAAQMRTKQNLDIQFEAKQKPCDSGMKIKDGKKDLIELKRAAGFYDYTALGGDNQARYSIDLSYIEGELQPSFSTLKCLNDDLTEDKLCSTRLSDLLRNSESSGSHGTVPLQRSFQTVFKAISEDKEFAQRYCSSNEKAKKTICSVGQVYEKMQVAISGYSIMCPKGSAGVEKSQTPTGNQKSDRSTR